MYMERRFPMMPKREMHGMRKPSTRYLKNDSSSYSAVTDSSNAPVEFSPNSVSLSASIFSPLEEIRSHGRATRTRKVLSGSVKFMPA